MREVEAREAPEDAEKGFLDEILRVLVASDESAGDAPGSRAVALDQGLEGGLVADLRASDQRVVLGPSRGGLVLRFDLGERFRERQLRLSPGCAGSIGPFASSAFVHFRGPASLNTISTQGGSCMVAGEAQAFAAPISEGSGHGFPGVRPHSPRSWRAGSRGALEKQSSAVERSRRLAGLR